MAIPQPLPHANEDPDNLAARAAKESFTQQAQAVRSNHNLSGRAKAEQITALWDTQVSEVAQAYERLTARRRARLEALEDIVPIGPGVPADASPADRAVLMTAFRAAWDQANDTDRAGRKRLLAEAERFDDGAMRRAVLTAAMDVGEMDTIRDWTALHADQKNYLNEVGQLRDALSGRGLTAAWDAQDFRPLPKPSESYEWQLIADTPHAQPGDNGRVVRPGIIEFGRQRRR